MNTTVAGTGFAWILFASSIAAADAPDAEAIDAAVRELGADAIEARKGTDVDVLIGMVIDGKRIAREGMPVLRDGQRVGTVTSGTFAPSLDRAVCLAYVHKDHAAAGNRLTIDVRGKEAVGIVVEGPFHRA